MIDKTIQLGIISWLSVIIIALIVIGYLRCENTDNRIQECLKSGHTESDCRCAFDYSKYHCDNH